VAQLKEDEWPADGEATTTEQESEPSTGTNDPPSLPTPTDVPPPETRDPTPGTPQD
jgi:hypothetical protein